MKTVSLMLAVVAMAQDKPMMPQPEKEHAWLKAFVGEWTTEAECFMDPSKPMRIKGAATGRPLGGFWTVLENDAEMFGSPWTGILTLGFDATTKRYTGTWVDSMSGYLWRYEGALDASGKVLTMETQGPCCKTGAMTKFRETIELQGKDAWSFTSSREEKGAWVPVVKVAYTRKMS